MAGIEYYSMVNPNLVRAMDPIEGRRVLEVGCGAGYLGAHMKARGAALYVGVEYVPEIAEQARQRLDQVFCGDIEQLDLPVEALGFDYLVFGDVLEHLRDPWTTLRKLTGFLKLDGLVVASIPNINHTTIFAGLLGGRFEYVDAGLLDRTHLRFFTLHEILDLFRQAGLIFDNAVSVRNTNPTLDAFADDLDALRKKYGIDNERFSFEARTYQWLIKARRC